MFLFLCCEHHRPALAVVQRFIHFSAYPQVMQQHRQLSGRRDDRPFLSVPASTLRELQAPASEITVHPEGAQNVLRSLHQQRAQIRITFLADMQLRKRILSPS